MKHRVAMLLDNPFRPDPRVRREAKALAAWGCRVTIYAWDRDKETERPARERLGNQDIEVVRIPVKSGQQMGIRQIPFYFLYAWRLFWLVLRDDVDVVHCHDFLNLPVGVLLKLFKRVCLVYDAHEIYWIMEARKYPSSVLSLLKRTEIALLRLVDVFITVGAVRAGYYRQHIDQPIYIVGNWYDPQVRDEQLGRRLRADLGIPKDAFVVTYAGGISPPRVPQVLVGAAARLQDSSRPVHWLIGGYGPSVSVIEQAAAANPTVHFLGWVENTAALFSASDALIYLMDRSLAYTAYNAPNNLYLSIAWALPLVGVNAGEIGAVLTSGDTGLLLDQIESQSVCTAVQRLAEQPLLYQRITEGLKALQGAYSWQAAAAELRKAYERCS